MHACNLLVANEARGAIVGLAAERKGIAADRKHDGADQGVVDILKRRQG